MFYLGQYGLLGSYQLRLRYAVSVFHAYGHQWACQLVYHPRKCVGFGLSDGEGCERFWSSMRRLIPSLRVSGVCDSCEG
jgi:Kyakuja-Dileera-Zisupton transposase